MAARPASHSKNSILKTSIPSVHASSAQRNESPVTDHKKAPDPRHLAIALHHARQIQARKDTEALVLSHILHLMELPSSSDTDASSPSPENIATFKSALLPFQPSDYDNLILERNIDGRCGYTLCPREHRKEDPKAKVRIVWGPKGSGPGGRGKEMRIVPKEKLEMWCSDECAERAMYIRVQLSETPAWERTERANVDIKLLEEARNLKERDQKADPSTETVGRKLQGLAIEERDEDLKGLTSRLGNLDVSEGTSQADNVSRLALERGDKTSNPLGDTGRVEVLIEEKQPSSEVFAPVPDTHTAAGGSIEGYNPKGAMHDDTEEEDDLLPCI